MRELILLLTIALVGCGCDAAPLNNPYPAADSAGSILYTTFEERPKHLDPASSYSENEAVMPIAARTMPSPSAKTGETSPDAIGRKRLVGCARSASTSFASLSR